MKKPALAMSLSLFLFLYAGAATVVAGGTTNDTEGRIILLADGRLMAAIARNPYGSWSTTDIYVSFSSDGGATWGAPALAVGGSADQATIAALQLPGDTIRLWYASDATGYYRINSAYSINGVSWTAEGQVDLGWGSSVQCYDPTVILEPDSSLTMIYRGGSGATAGAYVAHRPKDGAWDTLRRPVNYRAYRPRIMRNPDGTYLAAFQRQSGGTTTQIDVFVRRSTDLTNWTDSVRLTTNQNSHDAFCLYVPDSGYVVCYAKYQAAPYDAYNLCRRRSADGISWQPERQLTFDGAMHHNTQPCLLLHNGRLGLAWAYANDYDNDNDVLFDSSPLAGVTSEPPARTSGKGRLRLYPNPCPRGTAAVLDWNSGPAEARLYDAGGRFLRRMKLETGHPALVATASLSPGVYFVAVDGSRRMAARLTVLP